MKEPKNKIIFPAVIVVKASPKILKARQVVRLQNQAISALRSLGLGTSRINANEFCNTPPYFVINLDLTKKWPRGVK